MMLKCIQNGSRNPPNRSKNPHRAAVRPRRVGLRDKLLSNFADHLSANCIFFLFFCCLSVVYLVELYVFWVIRGNQKFPWPPSENSLFFWLSFLMDLLLIFVPFWFHFGSILHNFCIVFSSIDFERFFIRFWITFWMLKASKCVFFLKKNHTFHKITMSRKT